MNVLKFSRNWKENIAFCFVDNTSQYSPRIRELIKNQADGVLSNVYNKGYPVFQWIDEDELLKHVSTLNYTHAVIFSTGTEFINGSAFFDAIEELVKEDFFIAGHILDRKDAYYELHHQCYIINLTIYNNLNQPTIGKQELGTKHTQDVPWRSYENWHDDYTPKKISGGDQSKEYYHKCHGWNILKTAFDYDETVLVFDENIRNNKIHMYPESPSDFDKQVGWAYHRMNYCRDTFVHTSLTETINIPQQKFEQIATPASGMWFENYIDEGSIIYYDYNHRSLDYWKSKVPTDTALSFKFVECDLLANTDFIDALDPNKKTLINLSNIFNYEATNFFYNLEYRKFKELELIEKIKNKIPDVVIYSSLTAQPYVGTPTWHINQ